MPGYQSPPTTRNLATFPRRAKKWELFQNFFGSDSGKYVRQSSSLGKILYQQAEIVLFFEVIKASWANQTGQAVHELVMVKLLFFPISKTPCIYLNKFLLSFKTDYFISPSLYA